MLLSCQFCSCANCNNRSTHYTGQTGKKHHWHSKTATAALKAGFRWITRSTLLLDGPGAIQRQDGVFGELLLGHLFWLCSLLSEQIQIPRCHCRQSGSCWCRGRSLRQIPKQAVEFHITNQSSPIPWHPNEAVKLETKQPRKLNGDTEENHSRAQADQQAG